MVNSALSSQILVIPMQGKSHMSATNAIGQELKTCVLRMCFQKKF